MSAKRHENHEAEAEKSSNDAEVQGLPGVTPLSATSDIALAAAQAISRARSVVGQSWRKLVADLATIP